MDCKIWEKAILSWVNLMRPGIPITQINQLNDTALFDIIKKFNSNSENLRGFLKSIFPNLFDSDFFVLASSNDFLSAATCLLIYVSFSKEAKLDEVRNTMCTSLDNITQQNIAEFLTSLGNYTDVFQLSLKTITQEIFDFIKMQDSKSFNNSNCLITPVKNNNVSNSSIDSPLQGFFQTPKKRLSTSKYSKITPVMCGDGDHIKHIKQLKDHLAEEESEKTTLQKELIECTKKCNEYETKLKNKIEEIKQLKYEWEAESKKNEEEITELKDGMKKKFEEKKKLKSELSHLETFVSSLETDLANSLSDKVKLEHQLKLSLDNITACEEQLKKVSELNLKLQEVINLKDKELEQLKENLEKCNKGEEQVNVSYASDFTDSQICSQETLDVVVEKLLKEKIDENSLLQETINNLNTEKNDLLAQVEKLNKELLNKKSVVSELQTLNSEFCLKIEKLDAAEKELCEVQKKLNFASEEIDKLLNENSLLTDKYNSLNAKSIEQEKAFIECKNEKILLQFDFFKFAHDFNSVQQRLETEVNYITKLFANKEERPLVFKETKDIESGQTLDLNITPLSKDNSKNIFQQFSSDHEKMQKLQELLNYFQFYDSRWFQPKTSMQKVCLQLNNSIVALKLKISELEDNRKNSFEEKHQLEKSLKMADEKIREIQSLHSSEIQKLKGELSEKTFKIAKLEELLLKYKQNEMNVVPERDLANQTLKLQNDTTFIFEGGDFNKEELSSHGTNNRSLVPSIQLLPSKKEVLNDSLEEISLCSKTFEIVNLEEKNIIDKTFSIKKEIKNIETIPLETKNGFSWAVSPPPKTPSKIIVKTENRNTRGESWIVPMLTEKSKKENHKFFRYSTDLVGAESSSNLTKSSSLSSIMEATSSPHSKLESKSSGATSFFSVTNLNGALNGKSNKELAKDLKKAYSSELYIKDIKSEKSFTEVFKLVDRQDDPLGEIFKGDNLASEKNKKREWDKKFSQMRKEILQFSNECERLRSLLLESEQKRKKEKEIFEKTLADKNQTIVQSITSKYETQLEELKTEMKELYNRELANHKAQNSKLVVELQEQNKKYKDHIYNLRNQLWDVREKLLQEQQLKKSLEKICSDLKKKYENMLTSKETDSHKKFRKTSVDSQKDVLSSDSGRMQNLRQIPDGCFAIIPVEDEDEVFDNRFLEDLKQGCCPEDRLKELQNRNTLVLPHLKSSYPAETQFHNPSLFKEADLKFGPLPFGHESQSLTDSDQSMTRSLLPENKEKKKEQTTYKKPGLPTPSKNGGRLSLQGGDIRMTSRNVLKELFDQNEKNKGTPNRIRSFLPIKSNKKESIGSCTTGKGIGRDENSVPITPRKKFFGKSGKILRKPFGARDH